MKKTFRSILAGALALLAVSCYDDTDLQKKYGDLNDRVSAIETTLSAEVGGVNDLISRVEALEGKVAAIKVETDEKGVTTLTLSDNSKVILSKNGVLTVKDGVWYTVDPKTGAETAVGPVGHDLDFKVENGQLMYAPKGQTNYTATGVMISDYTAHVIGNVVVAEDGKSVAVTIGDKTLSLPLAVADGGITLSREDAYVGYGFSKTVKVEGAENFYVAAKPDGWKVEQEGNVLTVWAPSKELVELGAAHTTGKIVVHADADKCSYASMDVEAGEAFKVTMDKEANVTFFNAITSKYEDYDSGDVFYEFANATVLIMSMEDFGYFQSMKDIADNLDSFNSYAYLGSIKDNNELGGSFIENEYEEDVFTISLEDLGLAFYPKVYLEEGVTYVVCVIPETADGVLVENASYAVYKPAKFEISAEEVSHNDAKLYANLSGAEKYLVGCFVDPESAYDVPLEMAASNIYPMNYFMMGMTSEVWEGNIYVEGVYDASNAATMSALLEQKLSPNTKYIYFAIPYNEGDVYTDFATQIAPYVKTFTTKSLVEGTVAMPTFNVVESYNRVDVTFTPAEGTSVYHYFVTSETLLSLTTNADKLEYLMNYCYSPATDEYETYTSVKNGASKVLLYAVVDQNANYTVSELAVTALKYPATLDETLTVTKSEPVITFSSMSVDLTPVDGTKAFWKYYTDAQLEGTYAAQDKLLENLLTGKDATTNKTASQTGLKAEEPRTLVVLVVSGDSYNIIKSRFVTLSLTYDDTMVVTLESLSVNDQAETATAKVKVAGGAQKVAFRLGYAGSSNNAQFELDAFTSSEDVVYVDVDADGYAEATLPDYWGASMAILATGCKVDAEGKVIAISKELGAFVIRDNLPSAE